jgi:cysteine-rich repeat protein
MRRVRAASTTGLLVVGAMLASGGRAVAGTSTVTVDWTTDAECIVCSGNFNCSSDFFGWDNGMRSFGDPVPAGAVVTGVSVTVFAVFGCDGTADVEVELQGTSVAEHSVSDTCQCNGCTPTTFATTAAGGWPGYAYGGSNTLFVHLLSGVICADRAEITLTWADTCGNGTIEPYETCDDGNTTSGDGCSARCQVEPCYSCSGEPSTCSPQPDGTACDDGLFCNGSDTCSGAACSIHSGDPCSSGVECDDVCNEGADDCHAPAGTACADDGNVCTLDQCDGAGACGHPSADFAPCDDGDFCNGPDECFQGTCQFHSGDPCVGQECATACDELAGQCDPQPAGQPCTDDGEACTADQCDGMGACAHPPVAAGLPCPDDGLVCTADQCDGAGFCAHPPRAGGVPCPDDGNDCTMDECNGIGLCVHPARPDGTTCDDANACTQTDQCSGGQCVGTNPIVCTAPACHEVGTCDPSSGACTLCPAGYTPGHGGCEKSYAIDVTLLTNQAQFCDGTGANRFTCTGPFGFHWSDAGDASVGEVDRVDVELEAGFDCSATEHQVSLNGTPIGMYSATAAGVCACEPEVVAEELTDVDASTYVKGGANAVAISTPECTGLSADAQGHYAEVTVTYTAPDAPLLIRSDCRPAGKTKFRYENHANDARDRVRWKWLRGAATTQAEFGDPTSSANYQFCVFAETDHSPLLLMSAAVPPSGSSWHADGHLGYLYDDRSAGQDGMQRIFLRGGANGRSKVVLEGKGPGLSDPPLLLPPAQGLRVQLSNQASGVCWESELPASAISGGFGNHGP